MNSRMLNQPISVITAAPYAEAQGSLHIATALRQDETETYAVNRVVFTAEQEVKDLNQIGPNCMFIAVVDGVKFAFSSRGSFYEQAKLWHYRGDAVYSDMDLQIVDDPLAFDARSIVVSNSLPLWLSFNGYEPPIYGFGNTIPLFPSFLVPSNLPPPYGAIHVFPEATQALASAPHIGRKSSHHQLTYDRVRITTYGVRNDEAMTFLDCVNQRSLDYGEFGIMNIPTWQDEKRPQVELAAIAQKKSITFEIDYHQRSIRQIARQLIVSAFASYYPTDVVTEPVELEAI